VRVYSIPSAIKPCYSDHREHGVFRAVSHAVLLRQRSAQRSHNHSSDSWPQYGKLIDCDTNRNLISKTHASGTWSYTWDYENRLIQASLSGGVTVTYSYDALGRRIQRTSSTGGTTKFVYDGADVVRDLDGSGNTIAEYLNGPGIDNKLRQIAGGSTSYFLTDHLGTTRALTDHSGSVAANITYDSFGNITSGSASTRYTYTGREFDVETGLMYYRGRWYHPAGKVRVRGSDRIRRRYELVYLCGQ
jgi:YD repeat-containing protein